MRRWAEPLTILIVFAVVMTALGWIIRGGVEWSYPWVMDHIGHVGIWLILGLIVIVGAFATYRSSRLGAGR
jgi:hypothetical protein